MFMTNAVNYTIPNKIRELKYERQPIFRLVDYTIPNKIRELK